MTTDESAGLRRASGEDGAAFRACFGSFATGVAIASCRAAGEAGVAVTVNSLTSVSLDPPLALFCLEAESRSLAAFLRAGHFALNILAEGQEALSNRYAREQSMDETDFGAAWETGAPILDGALAVADCVLHDVHGGGDHRILVGRVREAGWREEARPLLYHRGRYGSIGASAS